MNIYTSAKGHLCVEKDGKNLHSKYNPDREAERFIEVSAITNPSIIILMGAGLGYILKEVIRKYPQSQIIAVYYSDEIYQNRQYTNTSVKNWFPSSQTSIHSFFSECITEVYLRNLHVLEWNPSSLIFPKISLEINKVLKTIIQQLNGNIKTTALFGKKWLRNMLCNYLSINSYCSLNKSSSPIVIVSSGPTLKTSLRQIQKYRDRILVWALPSSLKALQNAEIKPDLLISTDPGYYGRVHLNYLPDGIPVAFPLTGSRGIWMKGNPLVIINQSLPFEKDLFRISGLESIVIPSNGTVSGTALELALRYSDKIFFAGLDLCFHDIQSHIKPHSFDDLLFSDSHRSKPLQSIYYHRASMAKADFYRGIRTSKSLETYKNWFNSRDIDSSRKIKRLNPSPVHIDNIGRGDLCELEDLPPTEKTGISMHNSESRQKKLEHIRILLNTWQSELEEKRRDDLLYFIDTDAYTKGIRNNTALSYISDLRNIYG